jgi:uridine kinase
MSENEKIKENITSSKFTDLPYLIGITGGSGGGKTSVANVLYRCLGIENCLLFSMDTYYKNLTPEQEKNLNNYNFDTPDALDLDLLSEHLTSLMNWKSIEMPTYDFATNKRQKETVHLKPNKFIIFEGILAFHDKRMRDLMDLKLFIDLDDDIRLSRRIYRDIISRGRKMKDVIERYHKFVKPAYNTFIKPTKAYADIIIPRGGSNTIAIDLINYYLKYKLSNIFPENIQSFIIDKLNNSEEKKIDEEKKENVKEEDDYIIKKVVLKELLKKDNIELVKNEDIFDEKVCLIDPSEKKLYFNIFINYLLGKKFQYFDLYLDIFTKKIRCIVKNDIIIFINDEFKNVESIINKKIKSNKNEPFKVYIYVPILLENSEKLKQFIDYLKDKNEVNTISIISIFLKKEIIEKYDKNKIEFKSIYCGSAVDNYHDFIENGGYYSKMEGEYSNNLVSFSENNFEGKLAQSIEMNKIL